MYREPNLPDSSETVCLCCSEVSGHTCPMQRLELGDRLRYHAVHQLGGTFYRGSLYFAENFWIHKFLVKNVHVLSVCRVPFALPWAFYITIGICNCIPVQLQTEMFSSNRTGVLVNARESDSSLIKQVCKLRKD